MEVQPILADPASSELEDSDDECDDDDQLQEAGGDGQRGKGSAGSGPRMQGWIGRIRSAESSIELRHVGRHVVLKLRALSVLGRFCRCQVSATFAPVGTAVVDGQRPYSLGPMVATQVDKPCADQGALPICEAEAIADGLIALLVCHLEASSLSPHATSRLNAYHVGQAGDAVADALPRAAQKLRSSNWADLSTLPVLAVGTSTLLDAFLLLECTASKQE